MKIDLIKWLESWLFQNWENKNIFVLRNIDNPGWLLTLLVENLKYKIVPFKTIDVDRTKINWCQCLIKDKKFIGAGGPFNLKEILNNFKYWVELENKEQLFLEDDLIDWFQKWYFQYCDNDWEHSERFILRNIENPGWFFSFFLEETNCENKPFETISYFESKINWYHCSKVNGRFVGRGGFFNLNNILKEFQNWVKKYEI